MNKLSFKDKYLTLWIVLAMVAGLIIGLQFTNIPVFIGSLNYGSTNVPIALGLILMMYPVLTKVEYNRVKDIMNEPKLLILSLIQNWLIGPLLMFGLAALFLQDYPEYFSGLMLIGIARCIAMVLVWNDLAGGDRQYAAALVAFNSVFQIAFYSIYAYLFVTWLPVVFGLPSFAVQLPFVEIAESTFIYLGIPLIMGIATQQYFFKTKGAAYTKSVVYAKISPITLYALLLTIMLMFSVKAEYLYKLPGDILMIAMPLSAYFVIMFFASYFISKFSGADKPKSITLAFTAAGNNFELGIAVAIATFGLNSGQALATVIGPMIEVPVLVSLVWVVKKFLP